jgi:hypothetical protein
MEIPLLHWAEFGRPKNQAWLSASTRNRGTCIGGCRRRRRAGSGERRRGEAGTGRKSELGRHGTHFGASGRRRLTGAGASRRRASGERGRRWGAVGGGGVPASRVRSMSTGVVVISPRDGRSSPSAWRRSTAEEEEDGASSLRAMLGGRSLGVEAPLGKAEPAARPALGPVAVGGSVRRGAARRDLGDKQSATGEREKYLRPGRLP